MSERSRRLSVDIDRPTLKENRVAVLAAFFRLKAFFPRSEIIVDRTGHGFHVKAIGQEIASLPIEKRVQIREALCDDPLRIEYDKKKLQWGLPQYVETLFTIKKGPDGKIRIVEETNPLMLPSASRLPATKR